MKRIRQYKKNALKLILMNKVQTEQERPSAQELEDRLRRTMTDYFLIGAWRDRQYYYSLTEQDLKEHPVCYCGIFVNLVMDGELKKAWDVINVFPENSFYNLSMTLVHPEVTLRKFVDTIRYLKKNKISIGHVVLTAGRPSILNGVNDFTRVAPYIKNHKKIFTEDVNYLYADATGSSIYNLCIAEYNYQRDRLFDAEVLVSRTIKEFDTPTQRRLLFVALYLQSKILLANGKLVKASSYIKDIRNFVKKEGQAEFSYNIDAAEVVGALYENDFVQISKWLKDKAPDEYAEFCMLDLYRYMVKMRCYIVTKKYEAVIALAERLRPLLIEGKRHIDLCEIDMLLAITFYRAEKKDQAFEYLEHAVKNAKVHGYYRLIGDEGAAILNLLIDYMKLKGEDYFLKSLIQIARSMALNHPLYLKTVYNKNVEFSQTEIGILKFVEQGKSKEEISECFFITENTVKYHLKNIYLKLDANNACQAVWNARALGIL